MQDVVISSTELTVFCRMCFAVQFESIRRLSDDLEGTLQDANKGTLELALLSTIV